VRCSRCSRALAPAWWAAAPACVTEARYDRPASAKGCIGGRPRA
jgi:hypothetical protein